MHGRLEEKLSKTVDTPSKKVRKHNEMNEIHEGNGMRGLREDLRSFTVLLTSIGDRLFKVWGQCKVQMMRNSRQHRWCDMRRSVRIVRRWVRRIPEGWVVYTYHVRSFLAAKAALVPGISIACGTWKWEMKQLETQP